MGDRGESVDWMACALELAARADFQTSPNPMVGALVVKDGSVVGSGYHHRAGLAHAEAAALDLAGPAARGSDLWVSLEPCCHRGRTGPCTQRIIDAGVRRVHVATQDPNPRVAGRGIAALREAGLEVETGAREEEARRLIEPYAVWVTTGLPFISIKVAMSLDGRIATGSRQSQWITSEEARAEAHRLRHAHDAVLVGSRTVLADDPALTARFSYEQGRQPWRVVLDGRLRTPAGSRLLSTAGGPVVIFTTPASARRRGPLELAGARVIPVHAAQGRPSIRESLARLGRMGVVSVLVEGGPTVLASLQAERLGNRLVVFMAPTVLGGRRAPGPFGGVGAGLLSEGWAWRFTELSRVGPDLCIEARAA